MYQFFIQPDSIKEDEIWIADPQDVNHIRNVLRMKREKKFLFVAKQRERSTFVV